MHMICAGGLYGKGFGGHADSVFNEQQGRNHGNTVLLYAQTRLLVLSHTGTVHVAEDASESALVRYPGANEIVTGSPQKHVHDACHEVMTALDFSSHDCAGYGYCTN